MIGELGDSISITLSSLSDKNVEPYMFSGIRRYKNEIIESVGNIRYILDLKKLKAVSSDAYYLSKEIFDEANKIFYLQLIPSIVYFINVALRVYFSEHPFYPNKLLYIIPYTIRYNKFSNSEEKLLKWEIITLYSSIINYYTEKIFSKMIENEEMKNKIIELVKKDKNVQDVDLDKLNVGDKLKYILEIEKKEDLLKPLTSIWWKQIRNLAIHEIEIPESEEDFRIFLTFMKKVMNTLEEIYRKYYQ